MFAAFVASVAAAGSAGSGYDKPPQNILDVLHAPSPPQPYVSPTHDTILLVSWEEYPPMARVAEPFLGSPACASSREPGASTTRPAATASRRARRRSRSSTSPTSREIRVALPPDGCVGRLAWTADGKRFAFRNTSTDAVELWIGDAATGEIAPRSATCASTRCSAARCSGCPTRRRCS